MSRKLLPVVAVMLLLPWALSADIIVLKNGARIEAQGTYRISQGMVRFTGADGTEFEYPVEAVDLLSTEKATAQARRRTTRKVWTNDDVVALRGGAVSFTGAMPAPAPAAAEGAEGAEGTAAAEGAAAEGEAVPQPPKEETREYWQGRLQALQEQIQQVDQELQSLRSGQGQAGSNALSVTSGNPGVQVEDTIQRLEARRQQLQQQVADLQDEARRLGVSPSWVR
jgi:hypothetical protein